MRAMEKPVESHDSDLLLAKDATRFREWLVKQGLRTRMAKGGEKAKGILFWVRPASAWVSVDSPSNADGKFVNTHRQLRPYLNDFLLAPLGASVRKATRETPAVANTNGLVLVAPPARSAQRKALENELAQQLEKAHAGRIMVIDPAPAEKCEGSCGKACTKPAAPAPFLEEHLEDLRDDFALHAPFTMRKDETLQAFAARRWEYASAMMEARPANVRG